MVSGAMANFKGRGQGIGLSPGAKHGGGEGFRNPIFLLLIKASKWVAAKSLIVRYVEKKTTGNGGENNLQKINLDSDL